MGTRFIVVIISEHIQILSHVARLKLIQRYVSATPQFNKEEMMLEVSETTEEGSPNQCLWERGLGNLPCRAS